MQPLFFVNLFPMPAFAFRRRCSSIPLHSWISSFRSFRLRWTDARRNGSSRRSSDSSVSRACVSLPRATRTRGQVSTYHGILSKPSLVFWFASRTTTRCQERTLHRLGILEDPSGKDQLHIFLFRPFFRSFIAFTSSTQRKKRRSIQQRARHGDGVNTTFEARDAPPLS